MTDKEKTVFDLMTKYGTARGCEYIEIDCDPWNFEPNYKRNFGCGNERRETDDKFPFDPSEIIKGYITPVSMDIDEDNLTSLSFRLYPNSRKIIIAGIYQNTVDGPGSSVEISSNDNERVKEIMDYMIENDIYPYGVVDFHGGGDEGYIEDEMTVHSGDKPNADINKIPNLTDILYEMLSEFGGWENDEGSYGNFDIDSRAGTITLNFTWMEYQYEDVVFHEEKF